MNLIHKIDTELKQNAGFTINKSGIKAKHKTGFYVSLTNNKANSIKKAIGQLYKVKISIKNKSVYLGGWVDKNTGIIYIDYTIHIKNKDQALKTAKLFNQLAIYDIKNQNSVYLK